MCMCLFMFIFEPVGTQARKRVNTTVSISRLCANVHTVNTTEDNSNVGFGMSGKVKDMCHVTDVCVKGVKCWIET